MDKWRRRPCALAIAKPRKTGCAVAPGCQPGYWVRLATGEALFREGEEAGGESPQTPGTPPHPTHPALPLSRSPRLLFLQRHERFETRGMIFACWNFFNPGSVENLPAKDAGNPCLHGTSCLVKTSRQIKRLAASFSPLCFFFTRQETLSECKFKCAFNLPMGFSDYIAAGTLHIQIASQDSGSLPLPTIVSSCWTIGH